MLTKKQCKHGKKENGEGKWIDYEGYVASGIADVKVEKEANAPIYNLSGQLVGKNYKGVVIQGGKKKIQK